MFDPECLTCCMFGASACAIHSDESPVKYKPSNGTEGVSFMNRMCNKCQHEGDCSIIPDNVV